MYILTITQNEAPLIQNYCPKDILENISLSNYFTIGYFDDENFLTGVIQFYIYAKNKKDHSAVINYIHVHEDVRNEGVGTYLLRSAFSILKDSSVSSCEVRLPAENTDKQLISLFNDLGVSFDNPQYFLYSAPASKYLKSELLYSTDIIPCKNIGSLSQDEFSSYVKRLSGISSSYFTGNLSDYNTAVSSFVSGKAIGLFLLNRESSNSLEVKFLGAKGENTSSLQLKMISYSTKRVQELYDSHTLINIRCFDSKTLNLFKFLCPVIIPTRMIVGVKKL